MKGWVVIVVVILVVAIASLGFLSIKQNQDLNSSRADIASLQSSQQAYQKTNSDLQTSVSSLKTNLSDLQTTVTALQKAPTQTGSTISNTMVNLIPQIEPLIVRIDISGPNFVASGSGIVIRKDGYVITNQHVIDQATSIKVTIKGSPQYNATVTASDANLDLAILQLSGTSGNLPVVTLGATSDIVIGVSVVAAGFPAGLDLPGPASFSRGIVSAVRTIDNQPYVQTDATINPGSSGGGLFTLDDKLIGITSSAIVPPAPGDQEIDGLGLAIPVYVVQSYIQANLK